MGPAPSDPNPNPGPDPNPNPRLGVFAQDLAQDLPQAALALSYVADTVRGYDATINDERCRTVMGSLGLVGEKATRPIRSLSGGEKARVALATFCLTP